MLFRSGAMKLVSRLPAQQVLVYGMVGGVGFLVDALGLTVLSVGLHWDVFSSRAVSFACATFVTWLLNRRYTFHNRRFLSPQAGTREYSLYLAVQVAGAALNFLVFGALLMLWPVLRETPVIPLAGGAVVALSFNFAMVRRYVFGDRSRK